MSIKYVMSMYYKYLVMKLVFKTNTSYNLEILINMKKWKWNNIIVYF